MRQPAVFSQLPNDSLPYLVISGALASIGGTVDPDEAAKRLASEPFTPILDSDGRGVAIVWIGDFAAANLGPHAEVQLGLLCAPQEARVSAGTFAAQRALLALPGSVNVATALWNDTARVVSFNRDELALDARVASIVIQRVGARWSVDASDPKGTILTASFERPGKLGGRAATGLFRELGLRTSLRLMRSPVAEAFVANTTRPGVPGGQVARTLTFGVNGGPAPWTPQSTLTITHPGLVALDFQPASLLTIDNLRFAFGRPHAR